MPAGVIAGERIRALAGDGVPRVVCWWPGRRACGLPGRPGLPMSPVRCRLAGHGVPVVFETKIVTATAAVRLAEHRVLDLDVPVFGHVQIELFGGCQAEPSRSGLPPLLPRRTRLRAWSRGLGNRVPDPAPGAGE